MMVEGGGVQALAAASQVPQFHFISSLLLLNFILHFVKILTSPSISFSISSPPHMRGLNYIILPSTPQWQYLCPHNIFLLSLEKQRMERRINCLCVGKRLQKYLRGRMKKSGYKNVYIGESFFAYVGKSILRPQARCTKHFCIFCIHYLIVIYYI